MGRTRADPVRRTLAGRTGAEVALAGRRLGDIKPTALSSLDGWANVFSGTQGSRDKYDRLIGEWIAGGRSPRPTATCPAGIATSGASTTVAMVIAAFWNHAQTVYAHPPFRPKQRPKGELGNYWDALHSLNRLYADTPA